MCSKDMLTDISEKIAKSAKETLGNSFDSAVPFYSNIKKQGIRIAV